jgi:hypothetical protein
VAIPKTILSDFLTHQSAGGFPSRRMDSPVGGWRKDMGISREKPGSLPLRNFFPWGIERRAPFPLRGNDPFSATKASAWVWVPESGHSEKEPT